VIARRASAIRSPIRWPTVSCRARAPPPPGAPEGLPFAIHHTNLTQSGIYQIQNANLGALAKDKVWLSCTIILPLRAQGDAGSPVRPVAIGAPSQ
jgi:kynurenine formamidase